MISAVSNRGLMRFMLYEGALNADRFIAFLRRLGKDAGQKLFLIVDNLKVHHAGKVKCWVVRPRPRDRAVLPAGLRTRPQSRRISGQRPEAEAAAAAPAGIARRADQKHPCRAPRHPALTSPHPSLLHTAGGALRGLNIRYNVGRLVAFVVHRYLAIVLCPSGVEIGRPTTYGIRKVPVQSVLLPTRPRLSGTFMVRLSPVGRRVRRGRPSPARMSPAAALPPPPA